MIKDSWFLLLLLVNLSTSDSRLTVTIPVTVSLFSNLSTLKQVYSLIIGVSYPVTTPYIPLYPIIPPVLLVEFLCLHHFCCWIEGEFPLFHGGISIFHEFFFVKSFCHQFCLLNHHFSLCVVAERHIQLVSAPVPRTWWAVDARAGRAWPEPQKPGQGENLEISH